MHAKICHTQSTVKVTLTDRVMPVDVTLIGIVYVPGGVLEPPNLPPVPPVPPLELTQLETPQVKTAASTMSKNILLRLRNAKGIRNSPQASGKARHKSGRPLAVLAELGSAALSLARFDVAESGFSRRPVAAFPVEIPTRTLPSAPLLSVSVAGLKMQSALVGNVPH